MNFFCGVEQSFLGYLLVIIPSNRERLEKILLFVIEYKIYIDVAEDSDPAYIRFSNRCAVNLLKSTTKTLAMYVASVLIYFTFPIYELIKYQEISLIIPVLFPFTNLTSAIGVIVNMVNQLFTASIGISGNLGIEVIICMIKSTLFDMANSICHSIDELIADFNEVTQTSNRIVELQFRNIIMKVQDADR